METELGGNRIRQERGDNGYRQSKEISKASFLSCVLTHWKELVGYGGTENKQSLINFHSHIPQWNPLKLQET